MNGSFRHRLIYRILRPVLSPVLKLRFRYRFDRVVPRHSPCIVLCNHTTSWDPILISLAFPQPMYFVASEHIFRWGLLSKLIVFLQAPIARLKATADTSAVRQVLRRLQEGHSVCIFPEGCCTYSGETSPISAAIGKLVRHSGAGLVTYRIEGGYFTDPRWAQKTRRGPMRGVFVREYGPEALSAMNAAEINEAIARDLSYNAYETKGSAFAYTGRRLAQWLETALYLCPACGRLKTLRSRDDLFFCSCGLTLRYRPDGHFAAANGGAPPFQTVLDWFRWQKPRFLASASEAFANDPEQAILADERQELVRYSRAGKSSLIGRGTLFLYRDRMELKSETGEVHRFSFLEISDMTIHGRCTLMFTMPGPLFYEILSKHPRSVLPYQELFEAFRSSSPGLSQGRERPETDNAPVKL